MYKLCVLMFIVLMLVGCGDVTAPTNSMSDAGVWVQQDAEPSMGDASPEEQDADAGREGGDSGVVVRDGGGDGGSIPLSDGGVPPSDASAPDARVADAAAPDAGTADAGRPASDAGVDAGPPVFGRPLSLSAHNDTTCVLDDRHQMWCWGEGVRTPQYVRTALGISLNCGLAEDHHIFCWTPAGVTDYPDTDAAIPGHSNGWVRRSDGHLVARSIGTWAPPSPIADVRQGGIILRDGGLWFMDACASEPRPGVPTTYTLCNFWNAVASSARYDVSDALRLVGTSACWQAAGGGSVCWNIPGYPNREITLSTRSTEIELVGNDICMLTTSREDHTGGPGVRCVDRTDFQGTVAFPEYIEAEGLSDLAGGVSHLCAIRGDDVVCWGNNSRGQLGDGTAMARTAPTPVLF
jgi:hypothetical protein